MTERTRTIVLCVLRGELDRWKCLRTKCQAIDHEISGRQNTDTCESAMGDILAAIREIDQGDLVPPAARLASHPRK